MFAHNSKELTAQVASAVAYVVVKDSKESGKMSIGSCFHIGEGYYVTARHVVFGKDIDLIGRYDTSLKTYYMESEAPVHVSTYREFMTNTVESIFYHDDSKVDVAIMKIETVRAPVIQLSLESNQLTEGEFLMDEVVVLGYPPIFTSMRPHLVVLRGEVSAVVESYIDNQRHFVISGMARGGFSGGPVMLLRDSIRALGVVTESLVENDRATELGFLSALSTKPILEVLEQNSINFREMEMTLRGFTI